MDSIATGHNPSTSDLFFTTPSSKPPTSLHFPTTVQAMLRALGVGLMQSFPFNLSESSGQWYGIGKMQTEFAKLNSHKPNDPTNARNNRKHSLCGHLVIEGPKTLSMEENWLSYRFGRSKNVSRPSDARASCNPCYDLPMGYNVGLGSESCCRHREMGR